MNAKRLHYYFPHQTEDNVEIRLHDAAKSAMETDMLERVLSGSECEHSVLSSKYLLRFVMKP